MTPFEANYNSSIEVIHAYLHSIEFPNNRLDGLEPLDEAIFCDYEENTFSYRISFDMIVHDEDEYSITTIFKLKVVNGEDCTLQLDIPEWKVCVDNDDGFLIFATALKLKGMNYKKLKSIMLKVKRNLITIDQL